MLWWSKLPIDLADGFRAGLARHSDVAVKKLGKAYAVAMRDTMRELDRLVRRMEQAQARGEPITPNWLYRQERYRSLVMQMAADLYQYDQGAARDIIEGLRTSALYMGADHANRYLKAAEARRRALEGQGALGPGGSFSYMPDGAVKAMLGFLRNAAPLTALLKDVSAEAPRIAHDVLVSGVARGVNPRVMGRELSRALEGMTRDRGILIARTEALRAYRHAQNTIYAENDDVLSGWRWVAALNRFTCVACLAMHGTIHPLNEPMASHPACRCTAVPVLKDDPEEAQFESGELWMLKGGAARVKEMLGPARTKLYNEGVPLADMAKKTTHPKWGPGLAVRPIRELLTPAVPLPPPGPVAPAPAPAPVAPAPAPAPNKPRAPRKPSAPKVVSPTSIDPKKWPPPPAGSPGKWRDNGTWDPGDWESNFIDESTFTEAPHTTQPSATINAWLVKQSKQKPLDDATREAFHYYKMSSTNINGMLRGRNLVNPRGNPGLEAAVKRHIELIGRAPTHTSKGKLMTFRSNFHFAPDAQGIQPATVIDPAYSSTSVSLTTARAFSTNYGKDTVAIVVRDGERYVPMDGYAREHQMPNDSEKEVLLPRGAHYRLIGKTKVDGYEMPVYECYFTKDLPIMPPP